jgi:hypothetical protein
MKKGTKIALILLGVVIVGVGTYMVLTRKKPTDSGNKEKDSRKILIQRTDS